MSRYADPNSCPNCRRPAYGEPRCAACGLLLLGPTPQRLLSVLTDADRILDGLRAEAEGWRRACTLVPAADVPAAPRPTTPRSTWSTGSTLLALGALCLVVAGFIFVSVSWGSLGVGGRTAVLGAVTLVFVGAATAVTGRRLRASAEALWAVALAMLALDYAGAYAYGLLGLDALSAELALMLFGAMAMLAGAAVTMMARTTRDLWVAAGEVGACVGLTATIVGIVTAAPIPGAWALLVLPLPVAVLAMAASRLRLAIAAGYAACAAGLLHTSAALTAAVDAGAYETVGALFSGEGVLLTLAAAVQTAVLGFCAYRLVWRRGETGLGDLVAGATTTVAVMQLLVLAYAPALDDVPHLQLTVAVVAVALAVTGIAARGSWLQGIRVAAALSAVPVVWFAVAWGAAGVASVARSMSPVWSADVLGAVRPVETGLGSPWLAGLAFGALAVVAAATACYFDANRRRALLVTAAGLGLGCALTPMCLVPTPVVLVAAAVLGAGAAVASASRARHQAIGLGLVVAAAPIALASQAASLIVWCLVALAAVGIACRTAVSLIRSGAVVAAVAFAQLGIVSAVELAGADARMVHLCLVLTVGGTMVAAPWARHADVRVAAEAVAYAGLVAAVPTGIALSLGWGSAMLTVLGAVLAAVSLLRPDRRILAVPGAGLLAVAYVLRLVASDVTLVEAYTLPVAGALLVLGYARLRTVPSLRTRVALSPGLSLALLPSLPAVLADPTTPRGLLLGLTACALVGAGARLRWQAPFVAGAALAVLIVVRNVGQYADAVPRWGLIAAAGVVMLVVGVTWEARVRNARAAVSYVEEMR